MRSSRPGLLIRVPVLLPLVALLALSACGGRKGTGTRPDAKIGEAPVSHVELVVLGLSHADALAFIKELTAKGDIQNMVIKSEDKNTVVFELDVLGCECELPGKVAQIPYPGFRYQGRFTRIQYTAFDNKPPTLTFVHPEADNKVLNEKEPFITVEVPDTDVASVTINGIAAERYRGNVFRAKVKLQEGVNTVVATATDRSGNETRQQLHVGVDTTAPTLNAQLKVLVEGDVEPGASVLVDGKEAQVDNAGHYKAEVPVRKGQKQIEVIAIDKNGNKTVTDKQLGE